MRKKRPSFNQSIKSIFNKYTQNIKIIKIKNDFLKHKQANIYIESRRFGVIMTPFSRQSEGPQTNLDFGGQWHFLKAYSARADLQQNVGTFLAFLCSSNWNEWHVSKRRSKGPGIEFKVRGMSLVNFHVN